MIYRSLAILAILAIPPGAEAMRLPAAPAKAQAKAMRVFEHKVESLLTRTHGRADCVYRWPGRPVPPAARVCRVRTRWHGVVRVVPVTVERVSCERSWFRVFEDASGYVRVRWHARSWCFGFYPDDESLPV